MCVCVCAFSHTHFFWQMEPLHHWLDAADRNVREVRLPESLDATPLRACYCTVDARMLGDTREVLLQYWRSQEVRGAAAPH